MGQRSATHRFTHHNPLRRHPRLPNPPAKFRYCLEIDGEGKTAALKLFTTRGDLDLTGQGQWQISTVQIQFTGSATRTRERAGAVAEIAWRRSGERQKTLTVDARLSPPI